MRFGIGGSKNPGRAPATASMNGYPVRRRESTLEIWGSSSSRKSWLLLASDTVMSKVNGAAPERSRHRGANRFQPVDIDLQLLGLELIELRQYRQTWVKGTICRGSVSETKVAQDVRTSGGRWFTGRSKFLRESISRRIPLACFSSASTCEKYR